MAELIHFVADIVAKVGDVPLVRTEVKEVEDGSRRRLHDHPALAAACGCHLHLHVFGKRRKPAAVACFHDKQVIVELNAAELSPFLFKEHPDCRVRRPCVVGEVECRCLHGDIKMSIIISPDICGYVSFEITVQMSGLNK